MQENILKHRKIHKCDAAIFHLFTSSLPGHRQYGSGWFEHRPDHPPDIHRAGAAGHIDHRHRPQCNGLFPGRSADRSVSARHYSPDRLAEIHVVMAYTAGMVVGPLFCSVSMQVVGPSGFMVLPAIVPAFFILLVLRREGAGAPGGNRI